MGNLGEASFGHDLDPWALGQLRVSNLASDVPSPLLGKIRHERDCPTSKPRLLQKILSCSAVCFGCFVGCCLLLVCVFTLFFDTDLLSLCLIRPLRAGCTDPVSQTQLVSWIQQGCNSQTKATASTQPAPMPCYVTACDDRAGHPWRYQLVQKEQLHSPLSNAIIHWPQLDSWALHHTNKNATQLQHPNPSHTRSRPQT